MSKFFTTLFLTIATLLSGLVMATPAINVSAALNDPLRCSFPGRYIERSQPDAPCVSCPVDYYCPTQIRNGSDGKPSQFSPEKPGKNGQINSEVIPCPSGTTTMGFTYHPYKLSLLTKDEDGFKVGTLATDMSMCRTPDFKCPASTPRLVNVNGKSSCYSACPSAQVEVIKDGVQSCILECRSGETSVNGKCYEACKDGNTLTIINGIVNCNDKCLASSIKGQIVGPKGNCECPVGTQIIIDSGSYSTGRCGVVIISSSSSSVTPPPLSSSSVTPPPVSSSSSSAIPACTIPGQIRSYGTCVCPNPNYAIVAANGTKSCGTCPKDNFITQVGVEATGEITYKCNAPEVKPEPEKPTNNGGGGGSNIWDYVLYGVGAYLLYDGFTCGGLYSFVSCDSPKPVVTAPVNNQPYGPVNDCNYYGNCPAPEVCPSDRRPESTNNGTKCVCAYGTIEYGNSCGVEINVPSPKIPTDAKPRGRDFDPNDFTSFNYLDDSYLTSYVPNEYQYGNDSLSFNSGNDFGSSSNDSYLTSYVPNEYTYDYLS